MLLLVGNWTTQGISYNATSKENSQKFFEESSWANQRGGWGFDWVLSSCTIRISNKYDSPKLKLSDYVSLGGFLNSFILTEKFRVV